MDEIVTQEQKITVGKVQTGIYTIGALLARISCFHGRGWCQSQAGGARAALCGAATKVLGSNPRGCGFDPHGLVAVVPKRLSAHVALPHRRGLVVSHYTI